MAVEEAAAAAALAGRDGRKEEEEEEEEGEEADGAVEGRNAVTKDGATKTRTVARTRRSRAGRSPFILLLSMVLGAPVWEGGEWMRAVVWEWMRAV